MKQGSHFNGQLYKLTMIIKFTDVHVKKIKKINNKAKIRKMTPQQIRVVSKLNSQIIILGSSILTTTA